MNTNTPPVIAEYAIVITRSFFGNKTTKTRLIDNKTGEEWRGGRAEARAKIAELDNTVYHLTHNEACRPVYSFTRKN